MSDFEIGCVSVIFGGGSSGGGGPTSKWWYLAYAFIGLCIISLGVSVVWLLVTG